MSSARAEGGLRSGCGRRPARPCRRSALAVSACALSLALAGPSGAEAAIGDLSQLPGTLGCISEPAADGCAAGRALEHADGVTISPDGKNAYVAAVTGNAISIFDRDAANGALTQKAGTLGCISDDGSGGCADGRELQGATAVAISPDGKNVYVVSLASDALTTFDRDAASGALTQKLGEAGCVDDDDAGGDGCAVGRSFGGTGVQDVTVSPDGKNVYATGHNGVLVFDRDAGGALTQKAGVAGCANPDGSFGCAAIRGSTGESVTVSPDGENVYVTAANFDQWLVVFDRSADGTLTQLPGPAGCYSETASDQGCAVYRDDEFFGHSGSLAVSPDGKNAYALTGGNASMVVFDRDPATGALTPKAGPAGCFSELMDGCFSARGLGNPEGVKVSPDGRNVYVANLQTQNQVAVFDREPSTGALSQDAGMRACAGDGICTRGDGVDGAAWVALSPDGENVYVAASQSHAVAAFSRETPPPPPSASVDDVSAAEGNSGSSAFTFTLTLSDPAPAGGVSVDYTTGDGSASAGSDYTAASGTLSFAAAQTTRTLTVNVTGDAAAEPDESFFVNLSNPQGLTIGDPQGEGTIENDDLAPPEGRLTVVKQVVNDDGGTAVAADFVVHVRSGGADVVGSPQAGSASGTEYELAPGEYTVSEDAEAGYEASFSGDCAADGSVTLADGDDKTCTITNDDQAAVASGSLTVVKQVVNDDGGTAVAGDFVVHVKSGGADVAGSPQAGSASGTDYDLAPGAYTVSEDAEAGYAASFSGDCAADGSVTLADGDDKTCTITNDDQAPTLTVIKQVINNDGGTAVAGDFVVHVRSGGADVAGSPQAGSASGTEYELAPGAYTVSEDAEAGYAASFSGDCAADGSVTLEHGDDKTCRITNDDRATTLTVIKHVANDQGGTAVAGDWALHVKVAATGTDVLGSPSPGQEAPGVTRELDAGTYVVSESGGPSGYAGSISGDCAADGTVTLSAGEEKTCTIDNLDVAPNLRVIKHVVTDNGGTARAGDWQMHIKSGSPPTDVGGVSPFPGAESPGVNWSLSAGSYVVSESGGPAGYTSSISGDCAADGTIALQLGEMKTCTITNDDIAAAPPSADLSVTKSVSDATPGLGDRFAYTVRVTNAGPAAAAGVTMTDELSGVLRLPSAPSGCTTAPVAGAATRVTCALGDLPSGASRNVVIRVQARFGCDLVGTSGRDRIRGTRGRDLVCGGGGRDRLLGRGGDDALYGFAPRGRVPATVPNTATVSSATPDPSPANNSASRAARVGEESDGRDTVVGGRGADDIVGGPGRDRLLGGAGNDRMLGNGGDDRLEGGSGNDRLTAGSGSDRLSGGAGKDSIDSRGGGRDNVTCGPGRDTVTADTTDRIARNCENVSRR